MPAPALVEQDDAVALGIEEATMVLRAAPARTAVNEDCRDAIRIPAGLPIDPLAVADVEQARGRRLGRRVEAPQGGLGRSG